MSHLTKLILIALEEDEEIHGTNNLAELLFTDRFWLRKKLDQLEREGELDIIRPARPGRGHKNIIRRNRNSPGYPRRS